MSKHINIPKIGTYNNKYPHPVSGKPVSRQRVHQVRIRKKGECLGCGAKWTETIFCDPCAKLNGVKETHSEKRKKIESIQWIRTNTEISNDTGMSPPLVSHYRKKKGKCRERYIEHMILWMLYCGNCKAYSNFTRWYGSEYAEAIDFLVYRKRLRKVDDTCSADIAVIPLDREGNELTWDQAIVISVTE